MKPYEKYKESGVEWIGKIPEHWKVSKLKYYSLVITGSTPSTTESAYFDDSQGIPWVKPSNLFGFIPTLNTKEYLTDEGVLQSRLVRKGAVLVGGIGDIGKLGIAGCTLATNQQIHAIEGDVNKIDDDYLKFLIFCSVEELKKNSSSVVLSILTKTKLLDLEINLPPKSEQTAIAKYLDHQTAIIDELIEKKTKQIALLKEKRQAIINETVTKGLDPTAKMKDSGIEWLGEIPESWEVKKLKFVYNIKKQIAGELGYNVLSVTQKGIKIRDLDNLKGQLSMDYSKYQLVEKGDFIMNHMDLLTGFIDISNWDGVTSPDYRVFHSIDKNCIDEYYLFIFQFCYYNKIFFGLGQGVSQLGRWRMPAESFNNFIVPYPSKEEQQQIVDFLIEYTKSIDETIEKQLVAIEKLKEYRQSLISEAVTGKIDVR